MRCNVRRFSVLLAAASASVTVRWLREDLAWGHHGGGKERCTKALGGKHVSAEATREAFSSYVSPNGPYGFVARMLAKEKNLIVCCLCVGGLSRAAVAAALAQGSARGRDGPRGLIKALLRALRRGCSSKVWALILLCGAGAVVCYVVRLRFSWTLDRGINFRKILSPDAFFFVVLGGGLGDILIRWCVVASGLTCHWLIFARAVGGQNSLAEPAEEQAEQVSRPLGAASSVWVVTLAIMFLWASWPDVLDRWMGPCSLAQGLDNLVIMFVVRTQPRSYASKLADLVSTWLEEVSSESLMIASFALSGSFNWSATPAERLQSSLFEFSCPDNHGEGLCCVEANSLVELAHRRSFDWAFFVDDDAYVVVRNLRRVLARLHVHSNLRAEKVAYGTRGCGRPCGFCGGGGYALSAGAIRAMVGNNASAFVHRYMSECAKIQFCDVITGCLAVESGVAVRDLRGLHPWTDGHEFRSWNMSSLVGLLRVGNRSECPLSFHYVMGWQIHELHRMVAQHVPALGAATVETELGSATARSPRMLC